MFNNSIIDIANELINEAYTSNPARDYEYDVVVIRDNGTRFVVGRKTDVGVELFVMRQYNSILVVFHDGEVEEVIVK